MAILVVSERAEPFRFVANKRGQADRFIAPGATCVLTEDEWGEVPISMRGPGGLVPIEPSAEDAGALKNELEYYNPYGAPELRYLGEAPQDALTSDPVWTIRRFSHIEILPGEARISEIQILRDQVYDDRGVLAWS